MPSINMIAPRRAEKKRLEQNIRRLLAVIVVEVALIAVLAGFLFSQNCKTRSRISDLDVQLTKLQPTVNRIQEYEKATRDLGPKLETLNAAKIETTRWCRILNSLSSSMADKTWLTRIATAPPQPADTNIIVSLNGVAATQELVGLTMLQMHDTVTDFDDVTLHYTQEMSTGRVSAVEFEMAASIKLPENAEKEKVDKS
ncbi:MAG TPA: hypothetical protein PLU88_01490 [Armatimonadota bacterium]|nr:hypothetical protein [Armatimonadota bacterium]HPP73784.1 hypothetical protein [Armatimonadota bacterium]